MKPVECIQTHKMQKDNMQKIILTSLVIALFSGLAIGMQSSLISISGKNLGALLTSLLVNVFAGLGAGFLLAVIYVQRGNIAFSAIQLPTLRAIIIAGLLGIGIISGIAYALPKIGVAAGLSMIITGQMIMGVLADTLGLAGGQPIPLNWSRIGGLILLALGTWAIVPKE